MPPRLDLTPYWLIVPAIVALLVVVGIVVAAIVIASQRREH